MMMIYRNKERRKIGVFLLSALPRPAVVKENEKHEGVVNERIYVIKLSKLLS